MLVYLLTNTLNGKQYVGQTQQRLTVRWRQHRKDRLRRNTLLANALRKYGSAAFTIRALSQTLNQTALTSLEQFWIRELKTLAPAGYNLTEGGEGGRRTAETRAKMTLAAIKNAPKTSARMLGNRYNIGRKQTEEHVENKRQALFGNKNGLGNKSRTGHKTAPEIRAKISKALIGNSYAKGFKHSQETRAKVSAGLRGLKQSAETIAKRVATRKANKIARQAEICNG
jgi:group I intron endonuclease